MRTAVNLEGKKYLMDDIVIGGGDEKKFNHRWEVKERNCPRSCHYSSLCKEPTAISAICVNRSKI